MGIFGNNNNQLAPAADNTAAPPPAQDQPVSIDGMLPQTNDDQAMQQSVDDFMSQTAPTVNDPAAPPADYIMTDAPVTPEEPVYHEPETGDTVPVHTSTPISAGPAPLNDDAHDDLVKIKQQALQELSPLVGHLEQSPEEKFHTTMMMLQATDDQTLVKAAYEAAQAITDEKTRAQALLDVVNEINYFTQHKQQ